MIANAPMPTIAARRPAADGATRLRLAREPLRAGAAVGEFVAALGEDPERPGLKDSPRRVARMYRELFSGAYADPPQHLQRTFGVDDGDRVALRDIGLPSTGERHVSPFACVARAASTSRDGMPGRSKLVRSLDGVASRRRMQERRTAEVFDANRTHRGAWRAGGGPGRGELYETACCTPEARHPGDAGRLWRMKS